MILRSPFTRRLATLWVGLCLGACGGSRDDGTSAASALAMSAARQVASTVGRTTAAVAADTTALFDFGEANFRQFFPSHQPDQSVGTLAYRYYPETGAYLFVDGAAQIYVAGGPFGPDFILVGIVGDYVGASQVTTLAGSGTQGYADGTGAAAQFSSPSGVAVDAAGQVYVADAQNHRVRQIAASGAVTTLAGSGNAAFADGTGAAASFQGPSGVAIDAAGNLYVADTGNHRIRKVTPAGVVTTLAGSAPGFANGSGGAAAFRGPTGIAVDSAGHVYVADQQNHAIRKIAPDGTVTTLAGTGVRGLADGAGNVAQFNSPFAVAVDATGHVVVGDSGSHRIRKVTPAGVVSTLAGTGLPGFANAEGTAAQFSGPTGVAIDAAGQVYVADTGNQAIRKISASGTVTTLAGTGEAAFGNGPRGTAKFHNPQGLAVDGAGHVIVADTGNGMVRVVPLPAAAAAH